MKNQNINKIGLLCILDKKLLIVHKKKLDQYITLGGKIESGETDEECLEREVKEEIGCKIKEVTYFATFKRISPDGTSLNQKCYLGQLEGIPTINSNDSIDGYTWIDRNWKEQNLKLAPMLEYQIIPKLISLDLL